MQPGQAPKPLLSQDCSVYVFKDLCTVIKIVKFDQKEITKHQDNAKLTSLTAYNMVFEMVHDFSNPVDEFVPFIFTHRLPSSEEPRFDNYLVIFNLREFMAENYRSIFKKKKVLNTFLTI